MSRCASRRLSPRGVASPASEAESYKERFSQSNLFHFQMQNWDKGATMGQYSSPPQVMAFASTSLMSRVSPKPSKKRGRLSCANCINLTFPSTHTTQWASRAIPLDVLERAGEGRHGLGLPVRNHEQHQGLPFAPVRLVRPEKPSPLELNHVAFA